jgi:hypothetical protein
MSIGIGESAARAVPLTLDTADEGARASPGSTNPRSPRPATSPPKSAMRTETRTATASTSSRPRPLCDDECLSPHSSTVRVYVAWTRCPLRTPGEHPRTVERAASNDSWQGRPTEQAHDGERVVSVAADTGVHGARKRDARYNTGRKSWQLRTHHCMTPAGSDGRPSRTPPVIAKTVNVRTNATHGMVSRKSPNRTPVWLAQARGPGRDNTPRRGANGSLCNSAALNPHHRSPADLLL